MAIHKLNLELTWSQAEEIVNAIRELRDEQSYRFRSDWLETDYWKNPETDKYEVNPNVEPHIKATTVESAERELERRTKFNRMIENLTGEPTDDSDYEARVTEGRRLLDEQEAAKSEEV